MRERAGNLFGSPGLRLVQLYILLCSTGRPYTLTRLAGMFRCSRQTILRMMDQMHRVPGTDLDTWVHKKERFFRIAPRPTSPNMVFTSEGIRHLALCRDIVRHLLPETFQEELRETLNAVSRDVPDSTDALTSFAEPWVKGHIDYTPFQAILEDVQTAMHERRLCRVTYAARSSGGRHRYLAAPLHIIAYREALYLRCWLYDAPARPTDDFRTLAIHRIKRLRVHDAPFPDKPEDDHDPNFGFPFHEPIRVRVALWGGAATYVGERTWSRDQKLTRRNDGARILTFTATSRLEVIAWVLSFGPDAELLEPEELREEMREVVEGIRAHYSGAGCSELRDPYKGECG